MARQLRVVDGRVSDFVRVPRTALVEPAMEVQALGGDLAKELATLYALVWAGKRQRALVVLSGIQLSLSGTIAAVRELTGYIEELPSDSPDTAPARVA